MLTFLGHTTRRLAVPRLQKQLSTFKARMGKVITITLKRRSKPQPPTKDRLGRRIRAEAVGTRKVTRQKLNTRVAI